MREQYGHEVNWNKMEVGWVLFLVFLSPGRVHASGAISILATVVFLCFN